MVKTKEPESFDMLISNARGNSNHRGCPAPPDKGVIWIEVDTIPPHTKNWDKLILPGHKFLRRESLSQEPVGNFGRRRYRKR